MTKKVEVDIDDELIQEAIRRFHLADAREAIHLALRTLLSEGDTADGEEEEYDEFSDLSAWQPHRSGDSG
ncbi:MAG TPA: type II toxin-antitoxin system VapB family antitoxin [Mycobacterium sp.]|jgi:Arc/MetJ family transcription regulator|nr:type II toxin-antitoxin system VapB family antitoxin [Mycobacterium sp.]